MDSTHKWDIARGVSFILILYLFIRSLALILVICTISVGYVDTSQVYHLVRGQSVIKLYVIFNMLDVRWINGWTDELMDGLCKNGLLGLRMDG